MRDGLGVRQVKTPEPPKIVCPIGPGFNLTFQPFDILRASTASHYAAEFPHPTLDAATVERAALLAEASIEPKITTEEALALAEHAGVIFGAVYDYVHTASRGELARRR